MEQKSYKPLYYRKIEHATDEIVNYIDERRSGSIDSLKTRWSKFNMQCMGGIEPNTIYSICGISGSGKSSFVNSLESDLFELNPKREFVVLNFNFEMLSSRQVGRKLSYKLNLTTSELYSGQGKLNEIDYKKVKEASQNIKNQRIYYVDIPGNIEQIRETITHFCKNEGKGKWVIIILDHTLLTRNKTGESERETLAKLQYLFMEMKKYSRNTIIQLSQMNRNIESVERIQNISMHFPMRTDIFGGDSVFQASDYVMVIHRPELIIKHGRYGPDNLPIKNLIYIHFLKNREGELAIIPFINRLKYNRIDETDLSHHVEEDEDKLF